MAEEVCRGEVKCKKLPMTELVYLLVPSSYILLHLRFDIPVDFNNYDRCTSRGQEMKDDMRADGSFENTTMSCTAASHLTASS